jgi:pyridoxal phosphate enzyme (YggS family)
MINTNIKQNYEATLARIAEAAQKYGRRPEDITLISVSKTQPNEVLSEAYSAGIRLFGENKVQELADKIVALPADIQWHMIGHLQTNKVKYIVGKVSLIHSVDSLKLAAEIDKKSEEKGVITDVLLQVNSAQEETKFGAADEEVIPLAEQILKDMPSVRIRGLMNIAPAADNPDDVRPVFADVKKIYDKLASEIRHERLICDTLSMGMTHDFEAAIAEGSTMVRVGTGIFGPRNYAK